MSLILTWGDEWPFRGLFFAHPEVRTGSVGWQIISHIGGGEGGEKRQKSKSGSLEIDVMATSQLLPTYTVESTVVHVVHQLSCQNVEHLHIHLILIVKPGFYCNAQLVLKRPMWNWGAGQQSIYKQDGNYISHFKPQFNIFSTFR